MINKFSKSIYEKIIDATKLFGRLNLQLATLENHYILTYVLEAIDAISSNEIENIHTTLNEAYTNEIKKQQDPFSLYKQTLKIAHKKLMNKGIIQTADLEFINNSLRNVEEGIRKTPVSIKKDKKIIHKGVDVQNLNFELKKLIDSINIFHEGENEIIKALDIHHTFG